MKKGAIAVTLFLMLVFSFTIVHGEVSIPDDLMTFYARNVATLTLSNTSLLMYDTDRTILYYLYYNSLNSTLNLNISINCTSQQCPTAEQLVFDYLREDDTVPYVKKAAGIYVMTNSSKLGTFTYELTLHDASLNYTNRASFDVTVLSPSLWKQFLHNLLALVGL